tara:strand:- start:113 stop:283 length:171 start_codon:yes stop_codon:yes gene_type:complete
MNRLENNMDELTEKVEELTTQVEEKQEQTTKTLEGYAAWLRKQAAIAAANRRDFSH